jgi:hypothetical protein
LSCRISRDAQKQNDAVQQGKDAHIDPVLDGLIAAAEIGFLEVSAFMLAGTKLDRCDYVYRDKIVAIESIAGEAVAMEFAALTEV